MTNLHLDTPESFAWQEERDAVTRPQLESLASYEPFLAKALIRDTGMQSPVRRRGGLWFQSRQMDEGADLPCVTVRSELAAEPRVLVDPNAIAIKRGAPVDLGWAEPSPDGKLLAYAITEAGTEMAQVFLMDVSTGAVLPEEIPWSLLFNVSWLPDSSGFWGAARVIENGVVTMPIYEFLLGKPAPTEPAALPLELLFPRPVVSQDGRFVTVLTGNSETALDYVIDRATGRVRPLLLGIEGSFQGQVVGEDLLAITDRGAPRGRLVRIPLASAQDESTWTEVVAESTDVLRTATVVGGRIVLGVLRDAAARIRLLSLDGTPAGEVQLPGEGGVGAMTTMASHSSMAMFEAGMDDISFLYSDFATAPAVYHYDVTQDVLTVVDAAAEHLPGLTVTLIEGTSADGTCIPAHVVHRSDLDLSQTHPTLVTGYGGFALSMLPTYLGPHAAWVEAGGIYVLSHLRGGGEYGKDWWLQGRRELKQNTFNDLYAVAEELLSRGWTTPGQLACYGNSNGGLLMGAAVVQRPNLWAAVVPDVPALDLVNMDQAPVLYMICKNEYGDPLVPDELPWLQAISPLENVLDADYPATLVICGANDPRCPASHSRVFFDKLQRHNTGSAPVLLRVHQGQGHGAAGVDAKARRTTEWLAFCAEHTGLVL